MSLRPADENPVSLDWVLVANGARARLFVRDADNGALREVSDHVHPGSRMKGSELGDERAGQARKSAAATAFTARETPHEHERAAFARELAAVLEQAALEHRMPGWALIASNPFLGELKAGLGDAARRGLKSAIALDLTAWTGQALEQRVTQALQG
jgi:protein required for attachment to host cells